MENDVKKSVLAIVVCIFLPFFLLNCFTPMMTDDYTYSFVYGTSTRIAGLRDMIISLSHHYFNWSGRSVIFFFQQPFLLIGKPVYNVVTSFIFVFLVILIYRMAFADKKINVYLLFLISMGLWFLIPSYGETMLWMSGACNYLWVTVVALMFALPYRYLLNGKDVLQQRKVWILWFIFGIIAGWCNETISGGCALFIICVVILLKIEKEKIPKWVYIGFLGIVIGLFIQIRAPGNAIRTAAMGGNAYDLITLEARFTNAVDLMYHNSMMIYVAFVTLYALFIFMKLSRREIVLPFVFIAISIACHFVMIFSPYFPIRAMYSGIIFALIACVALLPPFIEKLKIDKLRALCAGILVVFAFQYYLTLLDTMHIYIENSRRETFIKQEYEKGNRDVVLDEIVKKADRSAWEDMKEEPDNWPNRDIAMYYGLNTICIEPKKNMTE